MPPGRQRAQFIERRIADAGRHAAADVAIMVKDNLNDLLFGPKGVLTDRARTVRQTIINLLELEGVL